MRTNTTKLRSTAARFAAVAVLAATAAGATAGNATADGQGTTPEVRTKTMGVELTPAQADRLRSQWEAGRELTPRNALTAAGLDRSDLVSVRGRTTGGGADEGEATVTLDCSEMTLWGDSDGHWTWRNEFWPRSVGPAEFGQGTVSTNAVGSTSDSFDISGLEQLEGGELYFAGIWPTATQVRAWSVNSSPAGGLTFCIGALVAPYE